MLITVTTPGEGREKNPNHYFKGQDEDDEENLHEAVSNLRYNKFESTVQTYPAFAGDGVTSLPVGEWEVESVWQYKNSHGKWENIPKGAMLDYYRRTDSIEIREVFLSNPQFVDRDNSVHPSSIRSKTIDEVVRVIEEQKAKIVKKYRAEKDWDVMYRLQYALDELSILLTKIKNLK